MDLSRANDLVRKMRDLYKEPDLNSGEIQSVLQVQNEGMSVHGKKIFLLTRETIRGLMEEMVSEVNFEKWLVLRYRGEGIVIITPTN